jgi:hypothetical protein
MGVALRQNGVALAKFYALRASGDHGLGGYGFKGWFGIAIPIVQPDRVQPAFFH